MTAAVPFADPWRFVPNYEVYVLVAFLAGAFVYSVRVLGPRAVPAGTPVLARRELWCFVLALVVLFVASTWPVHTIGEGYLYWIHMVQHMMFSHFLAPLVLLATPEWLVRLLVGTGRGYRLVRRLTHPVLAGLVYNAVVAILHIPGVVNFSTTSAPAHYLLHLSVVLSSIMMWAPIVGPMREFQMQPTGKVVYLFLMGVVPTIPAMWLAMADDPVYSHYGRQPVRVWGMSAIDDQQVAGVIMKVVMGLFMWAVMGYIYFARVGREDPLEHSYRRAGAMPDAEITGSAQDDLMYDDVQAAFDRSAPPVEQR